MADTSKKELFETMPVSKALMTMAVPTIISQLINLIYNIVDTFFIGRTGNSYMVAGVTVAFTIFMMNIAFSNLFGVGGGSLIARLIGRGDSENAKKVSAFSFYGAITIALLYSLIIGAFLTPILNVLGASENTIGFAKQYVLAVVVAGNLPTVLSTTIAHLLRNVGYSKQASFGLSSGGILNIILDPIFMFVLFPDGYEVLGAAVATLISNVIACLYLLITMRKVAKNSALSTSFSDIKGMRREDIKALFAVGIPSALLTALFDVANVFLNSLMSVHGDQQLAAIGIVMKAERLPNAINVGLCQAMLPIVAYNFSSGNHKRMQNVIKTARIYGLIVAAISLVLFELFSSYIVRLFLSTSAGDIENAVKTIGYATVFIKFRCLASPVQFLNYHTSFCMQAMGDGRDTLIHAMFRELVFYIPFMFLLDKLFNENGLACGLVVGELCGAIFAIFLLRRFMKKNNISLSN